MGRGCVSDVVIKPAVFGKQLCIFASEKSFHLRQIPCICGSNTEADMSVTGHENTLRPMSLHLLYSFACIFPEPHSTIFPFTNP